MYQIERKIIKNFYHSLALQFSKLLYYLRPIFNLNQVITQNEPKNLLFKNKAKIKKPHR